MGAICRKKKALPAVYRSDPHRSEPLSPQDWQLRANAAVPEIEALNAKVGEGTFRIDGLGNILADARKNDASIFADEVIDIADKHGLGIYFTGVHTPSIIRLRNAGFVTELGLDMILQRGAREKTDVSYPPKQSDRAWMRPPIPAAQGQVNMRDFGTIMSYKPRGFSSVLFSRAGDIPLIQRATDVLNETFSHPGKLSWWDKTVGSPYHLAQRYPAFKPVFRGHADDLQELFGQLPGTAAPDGDSGGAGRQTSSPADAWHPDADGR